MNDLQRTDEWREARRGKITASKFADVMSNGKGGNLSATASKYMNQILSEILTGIEADSYTNAAMEWGTEYEPEALIAYEELKITEVVASPFVNYSGDNELLEKYVGGSPDGLVGKDGGVEVKCPNTITHLQTVISQQVPKTYIPQVQGCLWLTGRKWWDFVSYDPRLLNEKNRLVVVRMMPDPDFHKLLEAKLISFATELDKLVKLYQ